MLVDSEIVKSDKRQIVNIWYDGWATSPCSMIDIMVFGTVVGHVHKQVTQIGHDFRELRHEEE